MIVVKSSRLDLIALLDKSNNIVALFVILVSYATARYATAPYYCMQFCTAQLMRLYDY